MVLMASSVEDDCCSLENSVKRVCTAQLLCLQLYLQAVIKLKPSVLQLGVRGSMLMARLMSLPQGYQQLSSKEGFLQQQLNHWNKVRRPTEPSSSRRTAYVTVTQPVSHFCTVFFGCVIFNSKWVITAV